jgi:hypothetical protein
MRSIIQLTTLVAASLLSACIGGNGTSAASGTPMPTQNTLTLTVDSGPPAAPGGPPVGAINHAYVTVKVCVPGSQTKCANIDHVLLDSGSWGLRLVRSVLSAHAVTLSPEADAQGRAIEECVSFGGGHTWGPVALADLTMAGESAAKLPVQVMDDTGSGAPPPAACGANGTLINGVSGFDANGVLGADGNGDFKATYNGGTAVLPALIDSGTDSYAFNDPTLAVCSCAAWVEYYCPTVAPQSVFAVNTGVGVNSASNQVDFAIADPTSFVANAAGRRRR